MRASRIAVAKSVSRSRSPSSRKFSCPSFTTWTLPATGAATVLVEVCGRKRQLYALRCVLCYISSGPATSGPHVISGPVSVNPNAQLQKKNIAVADAAQSKSRIANKALRSLLHFTKPPASGPHAISGPVSVNPNAQKDVAVADAAEPKSRIANKALRCVFSPRFIS
jgi:hypothetical protein